MISKKHIKRCKANSKAQPKINKTAIVLESESLNNERYKEQFIIDFEKDIKGWVSKLNMIASKKGTWTQSFKGKTLLSLRHYDGEIRLILKKPNKDDQVIDLSLSDFADIILAGRLLDKLNDNRLFSAYKVKIDK